MKLNWQLIRWETVLLLASIFVFRSVWLLLDSVPWMSRPAGLWVSLAGGLGVTMVALVYVNRGSKG